MHKNKTKTVIYLLFIAIFLQSCFLDSEHICSFDCMVADEKFLVRKATCDEPASYAMSCKCGNQGVEIFEFGCSLGHDFSLKLCDKKYLVSEANCTKPATYYYSCSRCDAAGKETFEEGLRKGHNFNVKVLNTDTIVPGQNYSCTVPYRYFYSCSCGAISDFASFEVEPFENHLFVEEADEKYRKPTQGNDSVFYKHCVFCGELSSETFSILGSDNQDRFYVEKSYDPGETAELVLTSGVVYVLKITLYGESFEFNVESYSGDINNVSFSLYEDKECVLPVDKSEFGSLDGEFYFSICSSDSGILVVNFSY